MFAVTTQEAPQRAGTQKAEAPDSISSFTGDGRSGPPAAAQRLFSNVNPATLRHEPGSVLGAAALVAGTTVGAGILALPYATRVRCATDVRQFTFSPLEAEFAYGARSSCGMEK